MTIAGHLAASYLLAQIPRLAGMPLDGHQTLMVLIAGTVIDFDAIPLILKGRIGEQHHALFTHTPLGIFITWTVFRLLTGHIYPPIVHVLMILSGLIHLALDDSGHWLCRLRLQKISRNPQITWFYPLKKPIINRFRQDGNISGIVLQYIALARASILLETGIVILGLYTVLRFR